jgi:hypothetical protein
MSPIFHGSPFGHGQTKDIKSSALDRLHTIIAKAKVQAASGTPSGLDRALRYLEREFKIGAHPQAAFGSAGISGLENEKFYAEAKQSIINARFLFNEAIYTNDENRRVALMEEAAGTILNIDAAIPYKSRAPLPHGEEKPPVSVAVAPRIYMERPKRKGIKETRAEAARKEKELEDKVKAAIEQGRQRMTKWQRKATEKQEKEEEAEAMKLVKEMEAKESGPIKTTEECRSRKTPEIYRNRKSEAEE